MLQSSVCVFFKKSYSEPKVTLLKCTTAEIANYTTFLIIHVFACMRLYESPRLTVEIIMMTKKYRDIF